MFSRIKAFAIWYKPYLKTFILVMFSAILLSGLTLLVPLITRHITKDILTGDPSRAPELLLNAGLVLLAVVSLQVVLSFYVDIRGHILGAEMERDMRNALFAHLTRQSFRFFDRSKTGALMSRLTNDLLNIAELAHHVPEEAVIYSIRLVGALTILFIINAKDRKSVV